MLDAALHVPGARPNHLLRGEPLDLSRHATLWVTSDPVKCADENTVVVERTFLKLQVPAPLEAQSAVTKSSSDAHPNMRNPRAVAQRAFWE